MPNIKKEKRVLAIKLTSDEMEKAGKDLAFSCGGIYEAEKAEAERRRNAKQDLEVMEVERHKLVTMIQSEVRFGEVQVRLDLEGETVSEIRLDTGEIILSRPATKEEMQQSLFAFQSVDGSQINVTVK